MTLTLICIRPGGFFICLVPILLCALPCPAVADERLEGVGVVSFQGKTPDAQARQEGLKQAKRDALENYISDLRAKGDFPPDRYRLYLDREHDMEASVDQFLVDVSILDQSFDGVRHQYRVIIGAQINQARFNAATAYSPLRPDSKVK